MTKRHDHIITYEQSRKVETKLVKAPRIKGNKVIVETPRGQRWFSLRNVFVWVFGGKTHMPRR